MRTLRPYLAAQPNNFQVYSFRRNNSPDLFIGQDIINDNFIDYFRIRCDSKNTALGEHIIALDPCMVFYYNELDCHL